MVDLDDLKGVISAEMENSVSDELVHKRKTAMKYYEGKLPERPDTVGRSGVVSTDVADSIEWLLPNIVESLTGRCVKFMPMSQMDEAQAELEEELTAFAFNEDNNGFMAMYEAVKDALLTGVGIMKIWFDDAPERSVEHYTGLDENQLQALLGDPQVEVTEIERSETDGIGVTCARIVRQGRVRVEAVPCSEFRISDDADSLDVQEARFAAHTVRRSASDLLAAGYDEELIDAAEQTYLDREVGDYSIPSSLDDSQKQIVVTEAYMYYDIQGDGISELIKVTYTGESNPGEILSIEEVPCKPFVAMSAIPMPHQFIGASIFERMQQVQDVKTAVLRATLDGMYHQIHKQKAIVEGMCNIDDVISAGARPGGIIRVKQPNAIQELGGNFFSGEAMQLLTYADTQKDQRVGVNPMGSSQSNLVNAESAHATERIMTAREGLVNMMVRACAETGLKPAYTMVRDLLVRYQTSPTPWRFRSEWVNVNPSSWGDRSRIRVAVGTGTTDDQMKMGALQQVLGIQQQLMQDPMNPLSDYNKMYGTLNDMAKIADLGDTDKFFYDPQSQAGMAFQQQKQQQAQQMEQQQAQQQQFQIDMAQQQLQAQQALAQAENIKANAQMENGRMKNEVDMIRNQSQQTIDALEAQLKAMKESQDQEIKRAEMQGKLALELTKLEVQAKKDLSAQLDANKSAATPVAAVSKK